MKYLFLVICLLFLVGIGKGQMKGDTTMPPHGGMPHSDQLGDSLLNQYRKAAKGYGEYAIEAQVTLLSYQEKKNAEEIKALKSTIDSLEKRPYLFIDLKKQRSGVWLTNSNHEYEWFISSINYN